MIKPYHIHDCDRCEHLGSEEFIDHRFDYYVCKSLNSEPDLIARYGTHGDYLSFPITFIDVKNREERPLSRAKDLYLAKYAFA